MKIESKGVKGREKKTMQVSGVTARMFERMRDRGKKRGKEE